jgi:hypothetical protein
MRESATEDIRAYCFGNGFAMYIYLGIAAYDKDPKVGRGRGPVMVLARQGTASTTVLDLRLKPCSFEEDERANASQKLPMPENRRNCAGCFFNHSSRRLFAAGNDAL